MPQGSIRKQITSNISCNMSQRRSVRFAKIAPREPLKNRSKGSFPALSQAMVRSVAIEFDGHRVDEAIAISKTKAVRAFRFPGGKPPVWMPSSSARSSNSRSGCGVAAQRRDRPRPHRRKSKKRRIFHQLGPVTACDENSMRSSLSVAGSGALAASSTARSISFSQREITASASASFEGK